jgi:RNA polymerase sigma-54 factor
VIHELEPSGVGARDLQECLMLQLKHKTPTESVDLATDISRINLILLPKSITRMIQNGVSNEQLKSSTRNRINLNQAALFYGKQ